MSYHPQDELEEAPELNLVLECKKQQVTSLQQVPILTKRLKANNIVVYTCKPELHIPYCPRQVPIFGQVPTPQF